MDVAVIYDCVCDAVSCPCWSYDFTEWYIVVGFGFVSAFLLALYIRWLEKKNK